MLKRLVKHGKSRAIVIDKVILEAAGISDDTFFQITINPRGGLMIQSVDDANTCVISEKFIELNQKHKKLMQNLADL